MKFTQTALLAASLGLAVPAFAADADSCKTVRLSGPGWSDIASTNALASTVLSGLGYEPEVKALSVPIGYEALKGGDLDAFLGNWMPAQQKFRDDLDASGKVEVLAKNLTGAKFTLAVPSYVADAGVTDFKDLGAERRQVRREDLRHRERRAGQHQHPEDDRRRRLRPRRLAGGRIRRAGDAGAGDAGGEARQLDRVPRLGAAPDERRPRHHLSLRRRRLLRPGLRRCRGVHGRPQGLDRRLPQRRAAARRTSASPSTWRTR